MWRSLKKLRTELPCDPAIPLLGIYPKENKVQKDTGTPVFTEALFTVAKTRKQPRCSPVVEWEKKRGEIDTHTYIHTYNGKSVI